MTQVAQHASFASMTGFRLNDEKRYERWYALRSNITNICVHVHEHKYICVCVFDYILNYVKYSEVM